MLFRSDWVGSDCGYWALVRADGGPGQVVDVFSSRSDARAFLAVVRTLAVDGDDDDDWDYGTPYPIA